MKRDAFRRVVDQVLSGLPSDLFRNLNGGVLVLPGTKADGDFLVMGEYIEDPAMGNLIALYYGSFVEELGDAPDSEWAEEIEETVLHEFRHHVELMAGVDFLSEEEREELIP